MGWARRGTRFLYVGSSDSLKILLFKISNCFKTRFSIPGAPFADVGMQINSCQAGCVLLIKMHSKYYLYGVLVLERPESPPPLSPGIRASWQNLTTKQSQYSSRQMEKVAGHVNGFAPPPFYPDFSFQRI